ncbi:TRAP transporter substrate-binding protein [Zhouia sp. PK063]|uniref:TRAP transporter substrate-binding protein n=1 Tax=Zhouia sp. PK063 TaxID=3373602 RepID=UPI00378C1840
MMKEPINLGKIVWFAITISILSCVSCNHTSKVKIIKLGHGLDTKHSVHKAMVYMADMLEKESHGTLKIDIYPNQQLGSERECVELLQIGSLGMTKVSAATMENFASDYSVFGLPYLFNDNTHRYKILEGKVGEQLLNSSIPQRLKGLAFYDSGTRNFYAKVPIKTPDDLKGLKVRVMPSKTAIAMVKTMGGSPTPISWGELYTALQQGIVDGAENNLPSFYLNRHYEVCKYFTMDEHTAVPDVLIISTLVWNKLNNQEQQWLVKAAKASAIYQKKLWKASENEALEGIKKAGVKIYQPDKALFKSKVKPLYDEFKKNTKMKALIDAIQQNEN